MAIAKMSVAELEKFLHEEDCPVPDIMDRGYAALYDGLGPGDPTFDGIRGEMQALLLDKAKPKS
jgi:hypothetical protein